MASGSTGSPWNLPFPVGQDQYALTSDLQASASQTSQALSAAKAEAVSAARWHRGARSAPLDALTAEAGAYEFATHSAAQGITPALPAEARGGGILEIFPGQSYRTIRYTPIGVTERPKPIWQNEYNVGLGSWYGWHRITPEPAPDRSVELIAVFGDSQSSPVEGSWDKFAAPLIDQRFVNVARGGDDSTAIGIRFGWVRPLVTVDGGVIPASGSVTLTSAEKITTRENRTLIGGTIAGVSGALHYDSGGQFTFTRSSTGDPVSVPDPVRFVSDFTTASAVAIVWMGGNDFNSGFMGSTSSVADHVVHGYQQAVEWGIEQARSVIVAGVTNRLSGGPGTQGFAEVQEVNRRLRETYPGQFLDVQGYYSEHAIYDAGLTPTQADLDAMAQGAIPPQLFLADGIHLTIAAHEALGAHRIAPWLVARGYATPATAVPAPAHIARETTEERLRALEAAVAAISA